MFYIFSPAGLQRRLCVSPERRHGDARTTSWHGRLRRRRPAGSAVMSAAARTREESSLTGRAMLAVVELSRERSSGGTLSLPCHRGYCSWSGSIPCRIDGVCGRQRLVRIVGQGGVPHHDDDLTTAIVVDHWRRARGGVAMQGFPPAQEALRGDNTSIFFLSSSLPQYARQTEVAFVVVCVFGHARKK